MVFSDSYLDLFKSLSLSPSVNFACRGLQMEKEMSGTIDIDAIRGMSVFSCITHRVLPIRFALAELCYILAGRDDIDSIASYNKAMRNYSDDGVTMSGSYGLRLRHQLPRLVERLCADIYTRQACATIYSTNDCIDQNVHIPCNVFLQFLCRPPLLDLRVISRSSDFVTGLSIDTLHWQALLSMMANELNQHGFVVYPNRLLYVVGSLHIYKHDMPVVQFWTTANEVYKWEIKILAPLLDVIEKCKNEFHEDMTALALARVLGIDEEEDKTILTLDKMFREHKNKLVR